MSEGNSLTHTVDSPPKKGIELVNQAKILVVEDERIVARDIQMTLERAGYRVIATATSGMEAIRSAVETPPDLVLMDVKLAGAIDGIEVARQIRKRREVPIVYLTANGDRAVLEQAKATEPIAFILKPYDEQELLTTIEMALHQYRAHQKRARVVLAQSEARYRELFDTARDGIAITDLTGRHLECNRAYLELLGYSAVADLSSLVLDDLSTPEFRAQAVRSIDQARGRGYSDEEEREWVRKGGEQVAVSVRYWLRKDENGQPVGLWVLAHDISQRKKAERLIIEYQTQLRSLIQQLSVAEERERQRIATDIHDRISQTLAVCQIRIETLAQAASSSSLVKKLTSIGELLEGTIRDTSSLTFELCPPVLHQLGLAAALEWFGERIKQQSGLEIKINQIESAPVLGADHRVTIFRAACELINNVVKHAQATRIDICLTQEEGILQISIEDDGKGFVPAEVAHWKREIGGFGLFHVRERMRAWGGGLEIHSHPGSGTCALLTFPLNAAQSQNEL